MEQLLFILLFIIGVVLFLISTRTDAADLTKTYQVEISLMSLIIWLVLSLGAFNIEIYSDTLTSKQIYDYGYIWISALFFLISFVNTAVLFFYGSFAMILKSGGLNNGTRK